MDTRILNHVRESLISFPWVNNRKRKDKEETLKYGPLRWELGQRFLGYEVKQYNIVMDTHGGS